MGDYNYSVFDMKAEEPHFGAFVERLHVGEQAPDLSVEDLESGEQVELGSLWSNGLAVIEFGSFT